jgi:hypothetical protein
VSHALFWEGSAVVVGHAAEERRPSQQAHTTSNPATILCVSPSSSCVYRAKRVLYLMRTHMFFKFSFFCFFCVFPKREILKVCAFQNEAYE